MGRRKQKQLAFVQGNSLAEELEASSSDDEEPGGLHIGGIVIRAPSRSRAAQQHGRNPSRGPAAAPGSSSRAAGTRNQPQQLQQEELERLFASEDSLDDEMRDYLDNVKQHDEDSDEGSEQDRAAAAAPAGAQPSSRRRAAAADVDSSSSEDWEELGSRPGLGLAGRSAAARFAAVSLDDALEGNLGSDMRQKSTSSSDDDSSSSRSEDFDSGSSSDDEDAAEQLDLESLDASTAVVVDAQGRPMAVWESLILQQRFPVQTRAGAAGESGTRKGSSSNTRRKRQEQGRQTPSRSSSGRAGDLPADAPVYECDVTAAAVRAAYASALAAADVEALQRQQRRQQQKSLVKGAQRGQLLPGEKKRLRKEKIAAKRCARRGERGQGALALLAAVERFALGEGDLEVLPPCGKHKQAFVRSIATLYGVRASAQGGSSSGRTCLVLASTPDTGPPAADAAGQLQALLAAELTREVTAAAIAAGPGEQPAAAAATAAGQQGGNGRQRRAPQRQGSRGAANSAAAVSAFQQPVAFVSAGTLDPNRSSTRTDNDDKGERVYGGSTILPPAAAAAADEPAGFCNIEAAEAAEAAAAAAGAADVVPQVEAADTDGCAAAASSARTAAAAGVGEFLQSLLLDADEEAPAAAGPAAAASGQPQQQQQQQQDEPAWIEDRGPSGFTASAGLGFVQGAAAVPAVEAGCIAATAGAAGAGEGASAPLYDRAPMHFGLGFSTGLGFVQQQERQEVDAQQQQQSAENTTAELSAAATVRTSSSSNRQCNQQLQALEDKFAALRAAPNPAAAKRQQCWQHRQQQQQQPKLEARLAAPNTALGPAIAAAATMSPLGISVVTAAAAAAAGDGAESGEEGSAGLVVTLGLTAQQVKKAKKQQLRNQRRESRSATAGAAEGQGQSAAVAAAAVGNVHGSFAGFEAHTRGIGSRLMAGWGWREGEGLGRARQGRPEPLQAVRRERQLGLGAE